MDHPSVILLGVRSPLLDVRPVETGLGAPSVDAIDVPLLVTHASDKLGPVANWATLKRIGIGAGRPRIGRGVNRCRVAADLVDERQRTEFAIRILDPGSAVTGHCRSGSQGLALLGAVGQRVIDCLHGRWIGRLEAGLFQPHLGTTRGVVVQADDGVGHRNHLVTRHLRGLVTRQIGQLSIGGTASEPDHGDQHEADRQHEGLDRPSSVVGTHHNAHLLSFEGVLVVRTCCGDDGGSRPGTAAVAESVVEATDP